jgi:hypothetical protein
MLLIPHSTNVTGAQALALLESLIPTLGLDPAQEIGVRSAIDELRDFTDGPGLESALETQAETTRAECEDEHADTVKALERQHADALDAAREESHARGYELGSGDCEGALAELLGQDLVSALGDDNLEDLIYHYRASREIMEARKERERLERIEQVSREREQAERERMAAVRKRGAPRKPRAKKAGSK